MVSTTVGFLHYMYSLRAKFYRLRKKPSQTTSLVKLKLFRFPLGQLVVLVLLVLLVANNRMDGSKPLPFMPLTSV